MIWATVSSRSCFYWLYRASPSLAAKNTINLISVLTIWWCPCVVEEGICFDQCVLLAKLCYLCPVSFCTPRPNLPVTPDIFWLPTFAFQSPMMKMMSFLVLVVEGLVGLHRTVQLQLLHRYWSGHGLELTWILNGLSWKWTEIILLFLRLHPSTAFWTLLLTVMASPFLPRDSCPQ